MKSETGILDEVVAHLRMKGLVENGETNKATTENSNQTTVNNGTMVMMDDDCDSKMPRTDNRLSDTQHLHHGNPLAIRVALRGTRDIAGLQRDRG